MKQYFEETGAGKAFFELLRAGLWGRVPEQIFFMDLKPDDWRQILGMAQKQAVLGLIYAGVSRLPKPLMPGQQTVLRLYGLAEQIRQKNREIAAVTREICGWFEEAGLEPIVLKGQSVGVFYAEPDLRQPGDLDLFISHNYEQVVSILNEKGYDVITDGRCHKFIYNGLSVDLHSSPFNLLIPIEKLSYDSILLNSDLINGIRVLNIKANALLLLNHSAKHFMKDGLGLRHLCDWAVFLKYYSDSQELHEAVLEMNKQGASHFVSVFSEIVFRYLALDLVNYNCRVKVDEDSVHRMLCLIIEQGNFGYLGKRLRNSNEWPKYYWNLWCYVCKSYPFWKIYFWKVISGHIFFRLKKIICGRSLETE